MNKKLGVYSVGVASIINNGHFIMDNIGWMVWTFKRGDSEAAKLI